MTVSKVPNAAAPSAPPPPRLLTTQSRGQCRGWRPPFRAASRPLVILAAYPPISFTSGSGTVWVSRLHLQSFLEKGKRNSLTEVLQSVGIVSNKAYFLGREEEFQPVLIVLCNSRVVKTAVLWIKGGGVNLNPQNINLVLAQHRSLSSAKLQAAEAGSVGRTPGVLAYLGSLHF